MSENTPADKTIRKGTCLVCGEDFFDEQICPNDGTPLQLIKQDANLGTILAERFEIISAIGQGGMSTVYKARHLLMDRIVAIKLLTASDVQALKRFQMEAKLACNLSHQNIVTVFDFGVSTLGQPYLVMDFLEGLCLSDIIKTAGPMPAERALPIFIQACDALSYAHKRDVVHRDLKPSNFMILGQQPDETLKLVDFGIAKQLNLDTTEALSLTRTGDVLGSPLYMSPEQCLGQKLDQRADIYSLGCVMYEVLTGSPPLLGTNALDILHKHINEDPPLFRVKNPHLTNVLPGLEKVVFKALERNRDTRYQTMLDLWSELEVLRHVAQKVSSGQNKGLNNEAAKRGDEGRPSVQSLAEEWLKRPNGSAPTNFAQPLSPGPVTLPAKQEETSEHLIVGGPVQARSGRAEQGDDAKAVRPAPVRNSWQNMAAKGAQPAAPGKTPDGSASWQIPSPGNKLAVPYTRGPKPAGQADVGRPATKANAAADTEQMGATSDAQANAEHGTETPQAQANAERGRATPQAQADADRLAATERSGFVHRARLINIFLGLVALAIVAGAAAGAYWLTTHVMPSAITTAPTDEAAKEFESTLSAGEDAYQKAHFDQAVESFQAAVKRARAFGENDPRLANALNNLGNAYFKLDQYPDAEQALSEALKIRTTGEENAASADSMTDLAMVYCAQGRLDKAEHLLNRGLNVRKRKCGLNSEEVADSLASLAALYNKQGRVGDAMKCLKQCLDIRNGEKNPHPSDLAATENSIATDYQMQHKLPQARLWFERAKNHAEAALGPNHPLVSDSLVGLASIDFLQNRYAEAEKLFNRAREIRDAAYGRENLRTAEVLACLAILKEQQGKYAEAKPLLFKALSIKKEVLGDGNPEVIRTTENYNDLLKHLPK